jgi:hypothetical protein
MKKLLLVISLLMLSSILINMVYADDHDLSGQVYPITAVKEGMNFSETTSKVEIVLDKIEKAEKDTGVYYDKITTITPKNSANQYCYVKVIIKQKGDNIVKEETMECADGRKKFDGPTYWELFAQFYYSDITTPEYCRAYSRPNHVFKSFGKTCLKKNGEWEVK